MGDNSRFRSDNNPVGACSRNRRNFDWRGTIKERLDQAAPYNLFLTKIDDCFGTHFEDLTLSFSDLLDESLGVLEHSVHINFVVDEQWVVTQYESKELFFSPMTIIKGLGLDIDHPRGTNLNLRSVVFHSHNKYGKMHSKMSIFFYIDKSVRFAIYTANLVDEDWSNRTQGLWISPKCSYMGDNIPINYGESVTFFKVDMIKYLASFNVPELSPWILRIQKCNLSPIRVCLVASVPGEYDDESFGYKKLYKLLRENVTLPTTYEWDCVVQCSSIGLLGYAPRLWFEKFSKVLQGNVDGKYIPAKVIFPSLENVLGSFDGLEGANCLPYTSRVHNLQRWIRRYLHRWQCEHRLRTKALPHIKSYARLSKDGTKLAWFLLTSANLSRAAWGSERSNGKFGVLSHELGILFLPKFFNGGDIFNVRKGGYIDGDQELFPLPYDAPLLPYRHRDTVFLIDKFKVDKHHHDCPFR